MAITDEQIQTLLEAIRDGVDIRHAGALAHISDSSLSRFTQHPENPRQERIGLQVREAQAEYLKGALAAITATGARGHEFVLTHSPTYRGDYGERTPEDTSTLQGLGQLYAAMTAAASATADPVRLGSAAAGAAGESLPLLTEHARGGDVERGEERARRGGRERRDGWEEEEEEGRSKQQ